MPPKPPSLREHADAVWTLLRRPWKFLSILLPIAMGLVPDEWMVSLASAASPWLAPLVQFVADWWVGITLGVVVILLAHAWWATRSLYRDLGHFFSHEVLWKVHAHKILSQKAVVEGPFCPHHRIALLSSVLEPTNFFSGTVSNKTVVGIRPSSEIRRVESGFLYCPEPGCRLMTFLGLPVDDEEVGGWTTVGSARREVQVRVEARLGSRIWRLRRRLPAWLRLAKD